MFLLAVAALAPLVAFLLLHLLRLMLLLLFLLLTIFFLLLLVLLRSFLAPIFTFSFFLLAYALVGFLGFRV